jgi:hypothetical protein
MNCINFYNVRGVLILIGYLLFAKTSIGYAKNLPLPDPLNAGWNGKPVCEHLFEDTEKRILRCTFPPGIGHERHFHVAHFGYAITGGSVRVTAENGVREIDLATGSSYTSQGVQWHEIVNIGKTTIRYLIVESKQKP